MPPNSCILCSSTAIQLFYSDLSEHYASDYYQCQRCRLIFAPPRDRPAQEEEKARYDTHENDPEDEGYRTFLSQLFNPLNDLLEPASKGLDFGSGPGPTLHLMFEEAGHRMRIYDSFYEDDPSVFGERYDFITATEVVEHLFHPRREFDRLWKCLRPGGHLGIMTKIARDDTGHFANWHYRLDITHVTFYTKNTFRWMADHWKASVRFPDDRIIIFQKPE
ncbi:class I SAM-dependent methyltransferase [Fodinibius sediminis]|uniref:Methyltransferase domain-containing protein n=1 Tax=Fodinibius sediminis TaxID=1214077 RepID=A0A521AQL3_9BACT|nr:class I SAM-dependent methyltransferase [Fodinibius sediminis]SMO37114.1 Methyltransferase domain-containing protein [Fodinibius sediminis]